MAIEIKPLADDVPFSNILGYGDSGAGKTVLAGSDLRVLFLAPEDSGTLSALRMGSKADKITVKNWEDLIEAFNYLYDHPEILAKYDWLCIDSVTEMQYMAKDYVLREGKARKIAKNQDPEKMQLEDYGSMHTLLENLVRNLNDLPVNCFYTATAKKVEDAEKNEFLVPDIQGKKEYGIAMKIAALMTSYGYLRTEIHAIPAPTEENPEAVKNVKRRVMYFEDTGVIRGKDRTIALAPFVINPTLQNIRRAMKGDMKRNKDGFIVKPGAAAKPGEVAPVKTEVVEPSKKADEQASPQAEDKVESKTEAKAESREEPTLAPKEESKEPAEIQA